MPKIKFRDNFEIGTHSKPYFVAELNTSHFGDLELAKKMIVEAKNAGCNCVKFQSWSASSINSKSFYQGNKIAERIFNKFSLEGEALKSLAAFSRENGISFSSTPYSKNEVDFLVDECQAPFVKVASMDLTNYQYLDYIAKKGVPIVLSTGMGEMEEIVKAVKTIEDAGNNQLCILHCISIYPPELSTIRLKNILGLMDEFQEYPIGFSDHSIGSEIPIAAVALGACLIEKHFTLDKSKIGMDNQIACEPQEMREMVEKCHNVFLALGDKNRIVLPAELEQRTKMRRSVVSARFLPAGHVIGLDDLDAKRPGTGIPPERIAELVGKKVVQDIEADVLISMDYLK